MFKKNLQKKETFPASATAHNQICTKFSVHELTKQRKQCTNDFKELKEKSIIASLSILGQDIQLMTSNALLAKQIVFFCILTQQQRSKMQPLCSSEDNLVNEVNIFFQKIKSLHVHHIAHIRAAAPIKIKLLSFLLTPVNQFLSICVIDFGGVNLVAALDTEVASF